MILPFLSDQRAFTETCVVSNWSVTAAGHAARWALGEGDAPVAGEELDPRVCRALTRRYGRLPANICEQAGTSTYGGCLVAAVTDDDAFVDFFAALFGAGLFGLTRGERSSALSEVPAPLRMRARREFEVIRNRGERPDVASTASMFVGGTSCSLRGWVGARVAQTLGSRFAAELAVVCGGWDPEWKVPVAGLSDDTILIDAWLWSFQEVT